MVSCFEKLCIFFSTFGRVFFSVRRGSPFGMNHRLRPTLPKVLQKLEDENFSHTLFHFLLISHFVMEKDFDKIEKLSEKSAPVNVFETFGRVFL